MGLGRNVWHFLSFISAQLSASHAPSGPHTTPLPPPPLFVVAKILLCYISWKNDKTEKRPKDIAENIYPINIKGYD